MITWHYVPTDGPSPPKPTHMVVRRGMPPEEPWAVGQRVTVVPLGESIPCEPEWKFPTLTAT